MSEETTKPSEGQEPNEIITLLDKHTRAITRMTAVLTRLSSRLDGIDAQLAIESEAAEPTPESEDEAERTIDDAPPLALLCNGRVAIHVSEFGDVDVSSLEQWRGVLLNESQASDVGDHLDAGFSGAAGIVGAGILKRLKKGGA